MAFTFAKPATGETFSATGDNREAAGRAFLAARRQILEARTDGKRLSVAVLEWSRTEGTWQCVESDYMGRVLSTVYVSINVKWYTPTAVETDAARIDSAADGGHRSMGMLGKGR